MADINNVVIVGRLTRDAELKYTSGGTAVSKLGIAVNKRKKQGDEWKEEASFFDVTLWGKMAEGLNTYLVKGKQIAVEGELEQERWEKDGQNHSKVTITASNVQLLGGGQAGQTTNVPAGFPSGGQPRGEAVAAATVPAGFPGDAPF